MSDTSKNYNIVIRTDVSGEESVKSLGDNVEQTASKFERMQLQIRKMKTAMQEAADAGDTIQFKKLRKELDDLEDNFDIIKNKTMQWDDQLAAMQGPLGGVGAGVKQVDSAFKMLKANPLFAILGVVAGMFLGIYEALKKTKEGQEALNKVSDAFDKILTPIINFISAAAIPVITAFANGIEWLGETIGLVDASQEKNNKTNKAASEQYTKLSVAANNYGVAAIRAARKANEELLNMQENYTTKANERYAYWVGQMEMYQRLEKETLEKAQKLRKEDTTIQYIDELNKTINMTNQQKERYAIQQKFDKYREDLIKQGADKNSKAFKLLAEEEKKELAEIDKKYLKEKQQKEKEARDKRIQIEKEAEGVYFQSRLTMMDDQERELAINQKKYDDDRKVLIKAGYLDGSKEMLSLNEAFNKTNNAIRGKYILAEINAEKERNDKIKEMYNTFKEDIKSKITAIHQNYLNEDNAIADDQSQSIERRLLAIDDATKQEIYLFMSANNITAENQSQFENQLNAIKEKGVKRRIDLATEEKVKVYEQYQAMGGIASDFGSLMSDLADIGDSSLQKTKGLAIAGIIVEKAGAIAQIISSTAIANAKAAAAFPLTGGLPWTAINTASAGVSIASTIAAAVKGIQQINSASKNSKSTDGSSVALPKYASAPTVSAPVVSVSQQNTVGQQVSESISNGKNAIKAYVVASDITTQQSLDRRTKSNSTF